VANKPSKETIAKITKGVDAAKAYVDSLPPDERASVIALLGQTAANMATDPSVSEADLLAELGD